MFYKYWDSSSERPNMKYSNIAFLFSLLLTLFFRLSENETVYILSTLFTIVLNLLYLLRYTEVNIVLM